jgi:hypothetical protein
MGGNNAGHRIDNKSGALKMVQPTNQPQQPKLKPVLTDEQRGLLLVVPSLRNNENG